VFKLIGMAFGVFAGFVFGAILATILRSYGASDQTIERIAFAVTLPTILAFGAWGGLLGYRRDRDRR
jgi:hypothetical protein